MYKYLWIIMLVIVALIFVGYTIYCLYESYEYWKNYKQRLIEEDYMRIVNFSLSDVAYDFWRDHTLLCFCWCLFILCVLAALFVDSLLAYVNGK